MKHAKDKNKKRSLIAVGVLALAVAAFIYVVAFPIYPAVEYEYFVLVNKGNPGASQEENEVSSDFPRLPEAEYKGSGNRVIIPKIGVNAPIVEAASEEEGLSQGAWRLPYTSTPDKGGNTVITAHRFKYLPPHNVTFYLLDKVKSGDLVVVLWEGERLEYIVAEQRVVEDTEVSVVEPTQEPILTLLTCHPLFSSKQRLVVIAEPDNH